jgi:hypothetical protein
MERNKFNAKFWWKTSQKATACKMINLDLWETDCGNCKVGGLDSGLCPLKGFLVIRGAEPLGSTTM